MWGGAGPQGAQNSQGREKGCVVGEGGAKERCKVRKAGDGKPVWTHCP